MSYYRICPYCGAKLDPGEQCDCQQEDNPGKKLPGFPHAKKKEEGQ